MKKFYLGLLLIFSFCSSSVIAQGREKGLPHIMTDAEKALLPQYNAARNRSPENTYYITPPSSSVRTIGEWEEL